jgi:hypothetical protein
MFVIITPVLWLHKCVAPLLIYAHVAIGGKLFVASISSPAPSSAQGVLHVSCQSAIRFTCSPLGEAAWRDVVHANVGAEVLRGVLHVPELAVPLFSVRAAVHTGLAVFFCPGQNGVQVVLQRADCIFFTASERSGLFYLDQASQGFAAAVSTSGPDMHMAMDWHRRLGQIGFSTLADLAR